MPINIQEILYPSDTDQIKWDKVNYNFDQILAAGGKEGPKGDKGSVGITGNTGATGAKGEKGDTGAKGEVGSSTNFWDQFDHNTYSANVVKPKDGTKTYQAAVILGDNTYNEGTLDGNLSTDAQLTVFTDSVYSYAQKWGPSSGNDLLSVRGESATVLGNNSGTKWVIQPAGQATYTRLELDAQEILIQADSSSGVINFSAGSNIQFNGSGIVTIANNGLQVDNTLDVDGVTTLNDVVNAGSDLNVAGIGSFSSTSHIKIPVGTTAQRPGTAADGMIRFNALGKYEGYASGSWLDFNRLSNAAKATYVSVLSDTDYALSENNKVNLVASGVKAVSAASTRVDVYKDLYMDSAANIRILGSTRGVIYPAGALKSSGIPPAGTSLFSSPSFGSADSARNLNDYYYQASYSPAASSGDSLVLGYANAGGTAVTWFSQGTGTGQFEKETATQVTYTKIGHQIFVNGYYELQLPSVWPAANSGDNDDVLVLGLGEDDGTTSLKAQFPFINASTSDILVNVELWDTYINTSAAQANIVQPYSNVDIYGIVKPGERVIRLYFTDKQTATSSTNTALVYDRNPLSPGMLDRLNSTVPLKILFSFNMPTIVNTGSNSYSTGFGQAQQGGGLGI